MGADENIKITIEISRKDILLIVVCLCECQNLEYRDRAGKLALELADKSMNSCPTCGNLIEIIRGQNNEILDKLCNECDWKE
jgi:hypothetical protein